MTSCYRELQILANELLPIIRLKFAAYWFTEHLSLLYCCSRGERAKLICSHCALHSLNCLRGFCPFLIFILKVLWLFISEQGNCYCGFKGENIIIKKSFSTFTSGTKLTTKQWHANSYLFLEALNHPCGWIACLLVDFHFCLDKFFSVFWKVLKYCWGLSMMLYCSFLCLCFPNKILAAHKMTWYPECVF